MPYDPTNIFARILRGEIPCKKVYEDAYALAFEDIAPAAPVHVLVVPKGDYASFHGFAAKAPAAFVKGFFESVQKIAEQAGLEKTGYRLIANHGEGAGQTVHHFHVHILGGGPLGPLIANS